MLGNNAGSDPCCFFSNLQLLRRNVKTQQHQQEQQHQQLKNKRNTDGGYMKFPRHFPISSRFDRIDCCIFFDSVSSDGGWCGAQFAEYCFVNASWFFNLTEAHKNGRTATETKQQQQQQQQKWSRVQWGRCTGELIKLPIRSQTERPWIINR